MPELQEQSLGGCAGSGPTELLWARDSALPLGRGLGTVATLCWEHGEATLTPWDGVNLPGALPPCKAPHKSFLVESSQGP